MENANFVNVVISPEHTNMDLNFTRKIIPFLKLGIMVPYSYRDNLLLLYRDYNLDLYVTSIYSFTLATDDSENG